MLHLGLFTRYQYPALAPLKSSNRKSNRESCFPIEEQPYRWAAGLGDRLPETLQSVPVKLFIVITKASLDLLNVVLILLLAYS